MGKVDGKAEWIVAYIVRGLSLCHDDGRCVGRSTRSTTTVVGRQPSHISRHDGRSVGNRQSSNTKQENTAIARKTER